VYQPLKSFRVGWRKTFVGYFFERFKKFLDALYMLAAGHTLVEGLWVSPHVAVDRCIEVFINLPYSDLNGPARDLTSKDKISGEASQTPALKDLALSSQLGEKVEICGQRGRYIRLFLG
jgi:hypothetical protein